MTKSAASDMAALAQGKKINNMLKEDFLKKKEQTLAENLILAKKYEAMAESNFNYPELWAISGNLYLEGYEFNSAARSFEKYFNIQREVDLEDKGLSVQLPAILHAEKLYINALIQNREYEKAELYLDKKLQEESLMSEESFSDKISFGITLSDIASRKGNWEKALKRFTELEKFITLHMNNYPLSQGTLAVILRARTLQIQVLAYLKKYEEARHKLDQLMELYNKKPLATRFSVKLFLENISFPKNWPLPKEESVRLAHIPSLTGQGKNYCVPIAVQFILRYFGDNAANQRQIAEEMGTTEQGTNFIQMIAYLKKKGFQVKAFIGTRERVGLFLKNSIPMLTLFYPKNADIGHIASLIGMDAQSGVYYFYEPAETSAVKAMSAEELSRLQIAVGNIFLAFVPQGRDFPREVNGSDSRQDEIALLILNYIDQMTLQRWEKEPREILDTIAKLDTDNKFQKFISFQKALLLLNKFYGNEIGEAELASTKKLLTDVDSFRVENGDSFHEYMRILGQLAYFVKDFARSRQAFMNAIALNPLDIQSIYMLAELLAREGQFQAAGVFYRKALAKLPYFHSVIPNLRNEILLKLAGIYKKEGKTGEMIQYLIYAANLTDLKNKLTLYTLEAMREHKSSNTLDFIRTFVESEK
jgi:tetratricopeptide (TPR) repeat protein